MLLVALASGGVVSAAGVAGAAPAGQVWTKLSTVGPSGAFSGSMAFDQRTNQLVYFGGQDNERFFNETWIWDGQNWIQAHPAKSPPPLGQTSMAYDDATGEIILFGGRNFAMDSDETWVWDGRNWARMNTGHSPPARAEAAMAYDQQTSQLVIFGGRQDTSSSGESQYDDTWIWDGQDWRQAKPSRNPPTRYGAAAAYDSLTGKLILFGGSDDGQHYQPNAGFLDDTWFWDGSTWSIGPTTGSPMARQTATMAGDQVAGHVVLFGGITQPGFRQGPIQLGDTWTWTGDAWAVRGVTLTAPAGPGASLAADPRSGQLILYGGAGHNFRGTSTTTWLYTPPVRQNVTLALDYYDTASDSRNPALSGDREVVLAAAINPAIRNVGGDPPEGTVTFYDGNIYLATEVLDPYNASSYAFRFTRLGPGTHKITISYSGDQSYNSRTNPPVTITVGH